VPESGALSSRPFNSVVRLRMRIFKQSRRHDLHAKGMKIMQVPELHTAGVARFGRKFSQLLQHRTTTRRKPL